MEEHLTDLAALEWARFARTKLAPEGDEVVRGHLQRCAACRGKVEAFRELERAMWPYGEKTPRDPWPGRLRSAVAVLVGVVVLATLLLIVL